MFINLFINTQFDNSRFGENNERTAHCIQMSETVCDLTAALTDLKSKYSADVLSEPLRGMSSDLIEFPRTTSDQFCPYKDSMFIIISY